VAVCGVFWDDRFEKWRLAANSEHGIFHGIGSYANNNGIENEGLFRLVYNRVGVTGTNRQ